MGVALFIPVATTIWGATYYVAPIAERVRHPLHGLLKASGGVGQAFGVPGLALFLLMWLYPIRKWLGAVRSLGSVRVRSRWKRFGRIGFRSRRAQAGFPPLGIIAAEFVAESGSGGVNVAGLNAPRTTLETGSGRVALDLECSRRLLDIDFPLELDSQSSNHLRVRVGRGRGSIEIGTGSGRVTVRPRTS